MGKRKIDEVELRKLAKQKKSLKEMAAYFHCSRAGVEKALASLGLTDIRKKERKRTEQLTVKKVFQQSAVWYAVGLDLRQGAIRALTNLEASSEILKAKLLEVGDIRKVKTQDVQALAGVSKDFVQAIKVLAEFVGILKQIEHIEMFKTAFVHEVMSSRVLTPEAKDELVRILKYIGLLRRPGEEASRPTGGGTAPTSGGPSEVPAASGQGSTTADQHG